MGHKMTKLKYKFKDTKLFDLALTQSGADAVNNNERLEFIGDRVLGLAVAAMLYEMFPNESEGDLARRHAVLVSTDTLAVVAKEFGFIQKIRHGHMTAGKMNHIAANAMESVLGAIFLGRRFLCSVRRNPRNLASDCGARCASAQRCENSTARICSEKWRGRIARV